MGAPVLSRVATILSPPFKTMFPDTGSKSSTPPLNLRKADLLYPMDPALSGGTRSFLLAKGSFWGRGNVTPASSEGAAIPVLFPSLPPPLKEEVWGPAPCRVQLPLSQPAGPSPLLTFQVSPRPRGAGCSWVAAFCDEVGKVSSGSSKIRIERSFQLHFQITFSGPQLRSGSFLGTQREGV